MPGTLSLVMRPSEAFLGVRRRGYRLQRSCPRGVRLFVGTSTYPLIFTAKYVFDQGAPSATRGLDSSTALEFIRTLRIATDTANVTTVVSILQAGEQLFDLFDKVCLIYEGKMAYFGPAKEAKRYFMDMGYEPQNRQTTPDFLVASMSRVGLLVAFMSSPSSHSNRSPRAQDSFWIPGGDTPHGG